MYDYPPENQSSYPATETNLLSIISLIAGILGWLGIFGLGGLVAVITGHIAKNQIKASGGRMTGDGLATAGLVLGYLNIALTLLGLCLLALMFAGVIGSAAICPFLTNYSY